MSVLYIDDVISGCKCTIPDLQRYEISPGEDFTIEAIYHSNITGHFRTFIEVYANIKNSPIILTIEGEVIRPNAPNPINNSLLTDYD